MFIEALPIEMRGASIVSFIMICMLVISLRCFYNRVTRLENIVADRSVDIARLEDAIKTLKDAIDSLKSDNQQLLEWVRSDVKECTVRIDKAMAEIKRNIHRE